MKHRIPVMFAIFILSMSISLPKASLSFMGQPSASVSANCFSGAIYLPYVTTSSMFYYEDPSEQEPNNNIFQANGPLRSGQTYTGYPDDRNDYFGIYLTSSGLISANLSNDVGKGVQLVLRSSGGSFIKYAFEEPFRLQYNAEMSGWYYILVFTESGFSSTRPYSLQVTYPSSSLSSKSTDVPITPASTPTQTLPTQWCDDFNDGIIDPTKWLPPSNPNIIYEQNGVLNMQVTQVQSQSGAGASLEAILGGRPVREISFITTFISYTGNIPAGAGPDVFQGNGPDHDLKVGPGPDGPGIEISICMKATCNGQYNDYTHINGGSIMPGESRSIRIAWMQERVQFYINDVLFAMSPPNYGPITDFQFSVNADPGSALHVTVDNVRVVFADS